MKVKNKSKLFTIIIILFSMLFLTGITLSIISTMNIFSNVKLATVIEVNDKTIKVQIGEQNGDPIIYELKKYKIFNIKENDNIYINIKDNKVKYSIKPIDSDKLEKIGGYLAIFSITTIFLASILNMLLKYDTLKLIIYDIPFFIGITIMAIFGEIYNANEIIGTIGGIIGFLLIFFGPVYMVILKKRKKK